MSWDHSQRLCPSNIRLSPAGHLIAVWVDCRSWIFVVRIWISIRSNPSLFFCSICWIFGHSLETQTRKLSTIDDDEIRWFWTSILHQLEIEIAMRPMCTSCSLDTVWTSTYSLLSEAIVRIIRVSQRQLIVWANESSNQKFVSTTSYSLHSQYRTIAIVVPDVRMCSHSFHVHHRNTPCIARWLLSRNFFFSLLLSSWTVAFRMHLVDRPAWVLSHSFARCTHTFLLLLSAEQSIATASTNKPNTFFNFNFTSSAFDSSCPRIFIGNEINPKLFTIRWLGPVDVVSTCAYDGRCGHISEWEFYSREIEWRRNRYVSAFNLFRLQCDVGVSLTFHNFHKIMMIPQRDVGVAANA